MPFIFDIKVAPNSGCVAWVIGKANKDQPFIILIIIGGIIMSNRSMKRFFLLSMVFSVISYSAVSDWDWWSCINTDSVKTPTNFLWGTALSEYQNSGAACCVSSNWSKWEECLKEKSGKSSDFWHRYPEDIELIIA